MRIEEDNERFCAATTGMCKSSNGRSEGFYMAITILVIVLRPGERNCQRGPAGQARRTYAEIKICIIVVVARRMGLVVRMQRVVEARR
jgi:hypothetical protein